MTFEELQNRCKGRVFDRIVVVVKDIFDEIAQMQRLMNVTPCDVRICTNETNPGLKNKLGDIAFVQRQASYYYENIEMMIVQPVEGNTLYKDFLEQFGEGICSVREHVSTEAYDRMEQKFTDKNLTIVQRRADEQSKTLWLDLRKELGIVYEMTTENETQNKERTIIPEKIAQVNITTPDVNDTIKKVADILEIGPWEVGRQCNRTVTDYGFRVDGELKDIEFDFLLAILPCGNLEWEAIEPVKGQLCYNEFIERRGIGFHHILKEVRQAEWTDVQNTFAENEIEMASKGKVGPIDWCYMDTEKELKFYSELRTDAVMTQLPDGYFEYFYPESNQE